MSPERRTHTPGMDINTLIDTYDIRLWHTGADTPMLNVRKPGEDIEATRRQLMPYKSMIVEELQRRERDEWQRRRQRSAERVRRLQAEHGMTFDDLKHGDLVLVFDKQMPHRHLIMRADAIIPGAVFDWRDDITIIMSEDDGESLARRLDIPWWLMDSDQAEQRMPDTIQADPHWCTLTVYRVMDEWARRHEEPRLPSHGATRSYWPLEAEDIRDIIETVRARIDERVEQEREERITARRRVVERFNEQTSKPQTRKDVKRLLCDYNNLYNEGGSGWLPWIVCREDAEQATQWLGEHGIRVTVG